MPAAGLSWSELSERAQMEAQQKLAAALLQCETAIDALEEAAPSGDLSIAKRVQHIRTRMDEIATMVSLPAGRRGREKWPVKHRPSRYRFSVGP